MNDPRSPESPTPPNPSPSPSQEPSLLERVSGVEQSLKTLAAVVNDNAAIMRDCFEVTEARQWMIMKVLDDIGQDGVAARVSSGAVDWEHYKAQYFTFQEELRQRAAAATEAPKEEDTPADAVVFGGG